jgi:hypothetical protein
MLQKYDGAILADVVGLGKTWTFSMLNLKSFTRLKTETAEPDAY